MSSPRSSRKFLGRAFQLPQRIAEACLSLLRHLLLTENRYNLCSDGADRNTEGRGEGGNKTEREC